MNNPFYLLNYPLERLRQHAVIAGLALFTLGCGNQHTTDINQAGVIYCSEGSPLHFNPQLDTSGTTSDATSHQIYDRLLDYDVESGRIVPGLASSWLISEDGLTYTFQLRKQVSFHSTDYFSPSRYFNADDVLFSINRWRLEDHPYHQVSDAQYPYFMSLGLPESIKSVEKINGYRVEITLYQPDSSFLANLATDFAVMLSEEYANMLMQSGTPELLDSQPIGTGPFVFQEFRKDRFIRYKRHGEYWKGIDSAEHLIFDITPSSSLRLAKLMTGECDAIALPAQSELEIIRQRPDMQLEEKPGLNIGFWAFNTLKPPFDNPAVRRALAMAIDKNTLLEAVYFGSASRAKTLVPAASWAYQVDAQDTAYNPVLARNLLDAHGVEPGFEMNLWAMPVERAYNPNATKMAELIQQYLSEIDVQANIVSYDWTSFRQRLAEGHHDSVLIGWSADNGDPDNFYRPLLTCAAIESGTNRAMWCSPEYDDIINQALKVTDIETRKAIYAQANQLLSEQLPLVPIAHALRYQAHRSELNGLVINPFGATRFAGVRKMQ
ncbi:ABC transporter substrate-binding protein SapA [Aestuariibacter salexigens]|uniref:ABC transporter substrate-binding protein SapA n=1 Tax=Aestuariibacter salexigens TaxID=226010 RepID=UPI0004127DC9|nr:ABC transporter substrate-binding protein SapA [Aestuariibacter salexigens]